MAVEPLAPDVAERQLRQACAVLDRRLRAGEPCGAEELLRDHPLLVEQVDLAIELVYLEFVLREELGQDPKPDTFCSRFPQWEERLRRLLGVHAALGQSPDPPGSSFGDEPQPIRSDLGIHDRPTLRQLIASPCLPLTTSLPRTFGPYLLLAEIGRGGMGVVYKARHLPLNRLVAVKMIADGALLRPDQRVRFRKEAEAIAHLNHPNVVQVYEVGEHEGRPFLALEYVSGGSLAQRVQHSLPAPRDAGQLVRVLATAMQTAHDQGIVHRDLKPANILLQEEGAPEHTEPNTRKGKDQEQEGKDPTTRSEPSFLSPSAPSRTFSVSPTCSVAGLFPKITDFGLACIIDEDTGRLTQSGQLLGTPSYVAPEQVGGRRSPITPATDVYGLGAILYELLTGRPPFLGPTVLETLAQVVNRDPVAPSQFQPGCPRDLETITLKCLEKDPQQRYSRAIDLAAELDRFLTGRPILARPVSTSERMLKWMRRHPSVASLLLAIVLVTFLGFAGVAWQWRQAQTERNSALEARDQAISARKAEEYHRAVADDRWYRNQIARVQQELLANNGGQVRRLLQECQTFTPALCSWEWQYLDRQSRSYLLTLPEQSLDATGVAFSSCGRLLATSTGEWNGTTPAEIRVWDADSGQVKHRFNGPKQASYQIGFQPGGTLLAATDLDRALWIWDLDRPAENPQRLAQEAPVTCLAFHPDGRHLAFGLTNGVVKVLDLATHQIRHRFPCGSALALRLSFHPRGNQLAVASRNGQVFLCDLSADRVTARIRHSLDVRHATFSADGHLLVTAGFEGIVKVWDALNPTTPLRTYPLGGGSIPSMALSPDGQQLAIGVADGRLFLWDFRLAPNPRMLQGHTGSVSSLAFRPDGRRLAVGGGDRTVKVWDLGERPDPYLFDPYTIWGVALASSPSGSLLAVAGGSNVTSPLGPWKRVIHLFDGERQERIWESPEQTAWHSCVAFRPDAAQFAVGRADGRVQLWDVKTRRLAFTLVVGTGVVHGIAYSPDGGRLATALGKQVRFWDVSSGQAGEALPHPAGVLAVAFAPRSGYLATGSEDGRVRLWDWKTGTLVRTMPGQGKEVTVVAFSPDGSRLAAADRGLHLRLWNTREWEEITSEVQVPAGAERGTERPAQRPDDVRRKVVGLTFSPDGRRLVLVSNETRAVMIDTTTGREVFHLPGPGEYRATSVAFSADGKRIHAIRNGVLVTWNSHSQDTGKRALQAEAQKAAWHQERWMAGEMVARNVFLEPCIQAGGWFASAIHARKMVELAPEEPRWFGRLAQALAEQGHWVEARTNYARAMTHLPEDTQMGYGYALTFLATGDRPGYLEASRALFQRHARSTAPFPASQVLLACLVAEGGGGDPARMVELARFVKSRLRQHEHILGAALYRAGKYREAQEQFFASDRARYLPRAWDWYFRAMCHHHLGRPDLARICMERASAWVEETDRLYPRRWHQWRERQEVAALRHEAETLLKGTKK